MTQPDEWYREISQKVVDDIFDGEQVSIFDAMIVFTIILKSTIYNNVSEDVSESDLLEDFEKVYDSIKIPKNDEVKKE
jgi:hypothetical protein